MLANTCNKVAIYLSYFLHLCIIKKEKNNDKKEGRKGEEKEKGKQMYKCKKQCQDKIMCHTLTLYLTRNIPFLNFFRFSRKNIESYLPTDIIYY